MANDHSVLNVREQESEQERKRIASGFGARFLGMIDAAVPTFYRTFDTSIPHIERHAMATVLSIMAFEQAVEHFHRQHGNDPATSREVAISQFEAAIVNVKGARGQ